MVKTSPIPQEKEDIWITLYLELQVQHYWHRVPEEFLLSPGSWQFQMQCCRAWSVLAAGHHWEPVLDRVAPHPWTQSSIINKRTSFFPQSENVWPWSGITVVAHHEDACHFMGARENMRGGILDWGWLKFCQDWMTVAIYPRPCNMDTSPTQGVPSHLHLLNADASRWLKWMLHQIYWHSWIGIHPDGDRMTVAIYSRPRKMETHTHTET